MKVRELISLPQRIYEEPVHGSISVLLKGVALKQLLEVSKDINHEETIGFNSFHALAVTGLLPKLEQKFVTLSNYLTETPTGQTVFHLANPKLLPHEFKTQKHMLLRDKNGDTPLISAVVNHWIADFPEELLTLKNLTLMNDNGISALDEAFQVKALQQIPALRTERIALMSGSERLDWIKALEGRLWDASALIKSFKNDWAHLAEPGDWAAL